MDLPGYWLLASINVNNDCWLWGTESIKLLQEHLLKHNKKGSVEGNLITLQYRKNYFPLWGWQRFKRFCLIHFMNGRVLKFLSMRVQWKYLLKSSWWISGNSPCFMANNLLVGYPRFMLCSHHPWTLGVFLKESTSLLDATLEFSENFWKRARKTYVTLPTKNGGKNKMNSYIKYVN